MSEAAGFGSWPQVETGGVFPQNGNFENKQKPPENGRKVIENGQKGPKREKRSCVDIIAHI